MKLVSHAPVDAAADQVIHLFKHAAKDFFWGCLVMLTWVADSNTADMKTL